MDQVLVRSWKNSSRIYLYDGMRVTRENREGSGSSTSGVFKCFLGYGPVVADKSSGCWRVYIDSKEIYKEDLLSTNLSKIGPVTKLTVLTKERKYVLIEMSWWDFFARSVDPTYDYLDESLIFSFWIHEVLTDNFQ